MIRGFIEGHCRTEPKVNRTQAYEHLYGNETPGSGLSTIQQTQLLLPQICLIPIQTPSSGP